jgi:hypothetical protein
MSIRSDEDDSMGGETQQIPNDMQYSSANKDKLYEPKKKGKVIRVLIVMAYVLSVSLAAIMLSLYYVFLWDPKIPTAGREGAPMALMDPGPQRNISCFHLGNAFKKSTFTLLCSSFCVSKTSLRICHYQIVMQIFVPTL